MISKLALLGNVTFPENTGERIYMLPFTMRTPLPEQYRRWRDTVRQMLLGLPIPDSTVCYLMVDQAHVKAGTTHRRAGAHIDGNWVAGKGWTTSGGSGHSTHRYHLTPEALVLSNDVPDSAVAYTGEFEGEFGAGGDCAHLPLHTLCKTVLPAHKAALLNVTGIHESLPVPTDCDRTVVRINVPGFAF